MKESLAYVKTKDLRGIMFQTKSSEFSTNLRQDEYIKENLSKLFDQGMYFFRTKLREEDDLVEDYTGIVVKTILTNRDRTGMWLLYDPTSDEVCIPGGHVDKRDVTFICDEAQINNPLYILQETLVRELYEEMYGGSASSALYESHTDLEIEPYVAPLTTIQGILYNKVKLSKDIDPLKDLWYLYKFPDQKGHSFLSFYYVVECDTKNHGFVDAGMRVDPGGFVWLSKDMWRISKRCKTTNDLINIFGEPLIDFPQKRIYKDARYSPVQRPIIDAIFNTGKLF